MTGVKETVAPAPFRFGTKAETLARLASFLTAARLCDQTIVPVARWRSHRDDVVQELVTLYRDRLLAIRSSSDREDGWDESGAGTYESVTDVAATEKALSVAFERVIDSYQDHADSQQVLVQPMVENVALSGVVLTRDLDTGGPYYVINYDDFSGRTDTVTSGAESKTVLVHRANPEALHSPRMRGIIGAVRQIEDITASEELDIEFCVTDDIDIYVLQVRPLAARRQWQPIADSVIDNAIAVIRHEVEQIQQPVAGLSGATTILGEMPDWNPAEMIGATPRPLALSLYERLITDCAWSRGRASMGYREVRHPLMRIFAGHPYVDVRLSLNSFLPEGLDTAIGHRLVDAELSLLADQPDLHDRIEFDVAVTCRDLRFTEQAGLLTDAGLRQSDIGAVGEALGALTARCINGGPQALEELLQAPRRLLAIQPPELTGSKAGLHALLDQTLTQGTIPFSVLARHGFIGTAFIRSLVARDALSPERADVFVRSIRTVAADVVEAIGALASGHLQRTDFLSRFGHLRPGTYDILSWRYDERPDLYLGGAERPIADPEPFVLSDGERAAIDTCLAEEGYGLGAGALLDYAAAAVAAREEAKFAFTRGLSDALAAIGHWAEALGLSREEAAHLTIDDILGEKDDVGALREKIAAATERHVLARAMRLPHLIVEPDDLDIVRPLRGRPTFITGERLAAPVLHLPADTMPSLDGKIILIESADPGFDWIFAFPIAGLITRFGGVNSHMAIRCAEFGLPAAIGCGERLFAELLRAPVIELDCANRRVIGR